MQHGAPRKIQLGGPRLKSTPTEQQPEIKKDATETKTNQYTPEQFEKAWDTYIATHRSSHILINTMRACRPVLRDNHTYTMTVESDIQAELIAQHKADILAFLHNTLSNTLIDFNIVTNQGAASPITWNERQVLQDIARRHPAFAQFAHALDLKLS